MQVVMKTLALFLLLSGPLFSADLYLRNESGNDLKIKIRNDYHQLRVGKSMKEKLDDVFRSDIKVFYQNRVVASTEISPSGRDSRLKIVNKNSKWLIEEDKR